MYDDLSINSIDLLRNLMLAEFMVMEVPVESVFGEGMIYPKLSKIKIKEDALIFEMADFDLSKDPYGSIPVQTFKEMLMKISSKEFRDTDKLFLKIKLFRGDAEHVPAVTTKGLELENITCDQTTLTLTTSTLTIL